jgi:hypothetical protein
MRHDPEPNLDGRRRLHAVAGLILLLIIIGFLVIFFATNWRRNSMDGGGFLGYGFVVSADVVTFA